MRPNYEPALVPRQRKVIGLETAARGSTDVAGLRDDVAVDMTPEQVTETQRSAQQWLAKHPPWRSPQTHRESARRWRRLSVSAILYLSVGPVIRKAEKDMGTLKFIAISAAMAAGIFQTGIANAQSTNVLVVRGGQPASIAETREGTLQVYRGSSATVPVAFKGGSAGAESMGRTVSAGSKIWIVDRAAGKLSVCRLASTTQIGEHRIDCHTGKLPR